MFSRRSALLLGEVYQHLFSGQRKNENYYVGSYAKSSYFHVLRDKLYDFLYENDYDAWFCNVGKKVGFSGNERRALKEFIMRLHTGEEFAEVTTNWDWKQREKLGQRYLRDLAQDVLRHIHNDLDSYAYNSLEKKSEELTRSLALDGYVYRDNQLLFSESDVLDVEEESGVLQSLYTTLNLANKAVILHHLELSETNYVAAHWGDVISNSRNFLECILQEVAAAHSLRYKRVALPEATKNKPFAVRDYLEHEGLLETKEKEALAKVYGLLSETGSHPYIAQSDQARLMRHLALTFSQFVMLRFQGFEQKQKSTS